MKNIKGFTLSEVMVTMGILGVLAAIIIPAVVKVSPDTNKVMFKKAYYTAEKAVSDLINDDALYPVDVTGTTTDTSVVVPAGFSNTDATDMGLPVGDNKFCYFFSQDLNTIGDVDCASDPGTFTTSDGISWAIADEGFPLAATSFCRILIDVNGAKEPNCKRDDEGTLGSISNCTNDEQVPDNYVIGVRYDGKINLYATAGSDTDLDASLILTNPTDNKK